MKKLVRFLALAVALFCLSSTALAFSYEPVSLTQEEAAAANLFLSNFTETGIDSCGDSSEDRALVDFAHDHMWFNNADEFEYGDYFSENNCRVNDERIQSIIDRYFYDPYTVDLTQTRFDYRDGYYYHRETGGWINNGFAHVVGVYPIEENKYFVSFMIFGGGEAWDRSVMSLTDEEVEAAYLYPNGYGSALIYSTDLSDRSTYKMISYARL